eukprot:XP_020398164.1 formin-like protein 16 [Zea mays]
MHAGSLARSLPVVSEWLHAGRAAAAAAPAPPAPPADSSASLDLEARPEMARRSPFEPQATAALAVRKPPPPSRARPPRSPSAGRRARLRALSRPPAHGLSRPPRVHAQRPRSPFPAAARPLRPPSSGHRARPPRPPLACEVIIFIVVNY